MAFLPKPGRTHEGLQVRLLMLLLLLPPAPMTMTLLLLRRLLLALCLSFTSGWHCLDGCLCGIRSCGRGRCLARAVATSVRRGDAAGQRGRQALLSCC